MRGIASLGKHPVQHLPVHTGLLGHRGYSARLCHIPQSQ